MFKRPKWRPFQDKIFACSNKNKLSINSAIVQTAKKRQTHKRYLKVYTKTLDFLIFSVQTCISELENKKLIVTNIRTYLLIQTAVFFWKRVYILSYLTVNIKLYFCEIDIPYFTRFSVGSSISELQAGTLNDYLLTYLQTDRHIGA